MALLDGIWHVAAFFCGRHTHTCVSSLVFSYVTRDDFVVVMPHPPAPRAGAAKLKGSRVGRERERLD